MNRFSEEHSLGYQFYDSYTAYEECTHEEYYAQEKQFVELTKYTMLTVVNGTNSKSQMGTI